jgi:hypothetical protein
MTVRLPKLKMIKNCLGKSQKEEKVWKMLYIMNCLLKLMIVF